MKNVIGYITLAGLKQGEYEITSIGNTLEYIIPYTSLIKSFQLTEIKNSDGVGYYDDYISEYIEGVGIKIIYNLQPPINQKIKFNYLIIR